ncbi:MAG TPA: hypothetical protein GXZ77_06935 [Papillibacter sp.]|jgi:transcription elongation GreA/GreB family factor|nr:hypothetical protein [Papillibacter sp.]
MSFLISHENCRRLHEQITAITACATALEKENKRLDEELSYLTGVYLPQIKKLLAEAECDDAHGMAVPQAVIGSDVNVTDMDTDEEFHFRIVSSATFELEGDDVTFSSPIGKALMMRKVGDIVEFNAPIGTIRYKIVSITLNSDIDFTNHKSVQTV